MAQGGTPTQADESTLASNMIEVDLDADDTDNDFSAVLDEFGDDFLPEELLKLNADVSITQSAQHSNRSADELHYNVDVSTKPG